MCGLQCERPTGGVARSGDRVVRRSDACECEVLVVNTRSAAYEWMGRFCLGAAGFESSLASVCALTCAVGVVSVDEREDASLGGWMSVFVTRVFGDVGCDEVFGRVCAIGS